MTNKRLLLAAIVVVVTLLTVASLLVGGYDITVASMVDDPAARNMFLISRVPRTLALIFAAMAMSISGVIMQMITQNKFVEPTTAGTAQWAGLGVLATLIVLPDAPPMTKMLIATVFALVGTLLFVGVLRRLSVRTTLVVPLVGIMLGAVVGAVTTFLAGTFDLLQAMSAWRSGGFSGIVRGFYEPMWAVIVIAVLAYLLAHRFTVAGLGKELATNVGMRYEQIVLVGVAMVAVATGVTTVVVGFIPFLGLIVPNLVSMMLGDDVRKNLPWVALVGAGLLLACDLVGRTVVAPMEIPASVVLGVLGAVVFVVLIVRQRRYVSA
ncbi:MULTISPECIES: ABC transporter permease [Rhodococcus]|jgi:iron complex transport system permease protein|uniref:Iron chelate uptake ABC transporter family permease subunit n=1 Tax=Rhodococcus cercidiphylli TaxID=489916 RepID=A0ABU4ATX4_9NOCA|nr:MULTISPECIES: iron chelate uptake ABC transporter family permease subunit [Rhodococcus]KAA0928177.1 iron chelate uptake ABC transporter family permease subunit [Rhodococcus sp. ANT_H53B]KZF00757.1 iron ABC transporter permease [Rhodococcus sp. EPR-279]KZF01936.1 iron ABC transporter permease [Rhodococcus sp. EPR-147]MDV6229692.1 iron chelate uptake ABC transporter family permease subunit [Rhodococcus cercidiphylli]MDV7987661.1 iron chelate uptake ABC transporter family permease subunit [Rho